MAPICWVGLERLETSDEIFGGVFDTLRDCYCLYVYYAKPDDPNRPPHCVISSVLAHLTR